MNRIERQKIARDIFEKAVQGVLPERLIAGFVAMQGDELVVQGDIYRLRPGQKVHVFGSGKASAGMAKSLRAILGERVAGGVVVTNQEIAEPLPPLKVVTGSHPIPDEKSIWAAEILQQGLSELSGNDFFIYLLSGGSSALIEKPVEGISLDEMQATTRLLLHSGVPIQEINVVRKHLSMVKGGRLAECTKAAGIVLVISDVIDDDLAIIGSGPLYFDPSTYRQCREILEKAAIWGEIPASVRSLMESGEKGGIGETPKHAKDTISHYLLGTNRAALEYARRAAIQHGLNVHLFTSSLSGEAREVAKVLMAIARNISAFHEPFAPPVCLLFGGETTVTVRGKGRGGRNQELVLAALAEIGGQDNVLILSGGTDGIDGNSPAAGAVADSSLLREAARRGLLLPAYLADNDAYGFFRAVGGLLETGPTGTNVMDIIVIIIDREVL